MKLSMYEVIVGNVGLVHSGTDKSKAYREYDAYVSISQRGKGCASNESVYLMQDGELIREHQGSADDGG